MRGKVKNRTLEGRQKDPAGGAKEKETMWVELGALFI